MKQILKITTVMTILYTILIALLIIGFTHQQSRQRLEIVHLKKEVEHLKKEVGKYKNQSVIIDRLEKDIEKCTTLKREYYKWLDKH